MKLHKKILALMLFALISVCMTSCLVGEGMGDNGQGRGYRHDNGRHRGWNNNNRHRHDTEGSIQLRIDNDGH